MGAEEMEAWRISPELFEKLKKWVFDKGLFTAEGAMVGVNELLEVMGLQLPAPLYSEISPAPWGVGEGSQSKFVFDKDGRGICSVGNANNRAVIRSAPELRKSLRKVVTELERAGVSYIDYTTHNATKEVIAEAREVLNAAGVNMEVSE